LAWYPASVLAPTFTSLCPVFLHSPGSSTFARLVCFHPALVRLPGSCAFAWLMCILLAHVHSPGSCASDQQVFTNTTSVIQLAMQPSDTFPTTSPKKRLGNCVAPKILCFHCVSPGPFAGMIANRKPRLVGKDGDGVAR